MTANQSDMSADEWRKFAQRAPLYTAQQKAKELGADVRGTASG